MKDKSKSVLVEIFGETPFIKMVDTFMDHPSYEYTKTELAEVNNISRSTVYNNWDRIEELGIVENGKKVGSTQLYRLNKSSKLVEKLYKFEKEVREEEEINKLIEA